MSVSAVIAALALRRPPAVLKRRLGVRDGFVLYDGGQGRIEPFPMREVLTDGPRLLVGRYQIIFGIQGLPTPWNPDEIRSEILARLPKQSWCSRYKIEGAMYRRNPALLVLVFFALVVMVAILLFPNFLK